LNELLDILTQSIQEEWQALVRLMPRLVVALVVFLLFTWVGRLAGRLVSRLLERGRLTGTHRTFFRHLTTWVGAFIGLVIALNVMGLQTVAAGLLAGGGFTAVALGFAFRGVGENLLAGLFLAFSRPFEVGDIIQSRDFQGQVKGIEMRNTHIRTADGRDVYIPSSQVFNEPVVNFTKDGLRRLSFTVGIDYAEDSDRALQLLAETCQGSEGVLEAPAAQAMISAMLPQYLELEVAFWLDFLAPGANLASIRTRVMGRCRQALKDNGFVLSSDVTTNIHVDDGR
jgi:small-conductance mechanosensitive channel